MLSYCVKMITFKSSTNTKCKHRQHKPRRRSVKKLLVVYIVNVLLTTPEEFYLPSAKRHVTHALRKRSAVQIL